VADEPSFLDPDLAGIRNDDQCQGEQAANLVFCQCRSQKGQHQAGIDGVPDKRVRSTADQLVLRLDIDGAAPVLPKVNARLHRKSQAQRLEYYTGDKRDEATREESPLQETNFEDGEGQQGERSRKQGKMRQPRRRRLSLGGLLRAARGGHPVDRPQQPEASNYPVCVSH